MLPGKKYTPEDILQIAWRRRWFIIVPFLVVAPATFLVARAVPDRFRASTVILVVPQRVPESYVRSTITTRIEERLNTISQQILSRTRLERVINEFQLYPRLREQLPMEDVVEQMRRDVDVRIARGDAFTVSYESEDARTAARVADRLAGMFMEESTTDRATQAVAANDFLKNQLADTARRLDEQEKRVADYKRTHAGQLPSEMQANIQALNNTQLQLQNLTEATTRNADRRVLLQRTVQDLEAAGGQADSAVLVSPNDPTAISGGSWAAQLEVARAQLRAMELRLTAKHPDIARMKRVITEIEAKAEAEAIEKPLSPGAAGAAAGRRVSPEEQARLSKLQSARTELEQVERQLAFQDKEQERLRGVMAMYQARLDATPIRDAELMQLTRDYDTLRQTHQSLMSKQEESKMAANMEQGQIGEQFRTLDAARVPERPFSPNRPFIHLAGALAGLGLGLGLAALLEYRDTSYRSEDDVVRVLALPVLATIPVLLTASDRRRIRRRQILTAAASACLVLAAGGAAAAWKLGWLDFLRRFLS